MTFNDPIEQIVKRVVDLSNTTTDLEKLAYAGSAIAKLSEAAKDLPPKQDAFNIGTPGTAGFGVAAIKDELLPSGWTKLPGHEDVYNSNYGNVLTPDGSVMAWIPTYYHALSGNTQIISATPQNGLVLGREFIDGGVQKKGFFRDKYQCSNQGSIAKSVRYGKPLTFASSHNPISGLNGTPANRLDGFFAAVKTRGAGFAPESIFQRRSLARLTLAHAQASNSTAFCAWADMEPKAPRGNNNNNLTDVNNPSITFTSDGYAMCALTGSANILAQTTHNGQECGVADINGNVWAAVIGLITNADGTAFLVLKPSVSIANLTDVSAYDMNNYESIGIINIINNAASWKYLGNGTNQIYPFSVDSASNSYKQEACGLPLLAGTNNSGFTNIIQDAVYTPASPALSMIVLAGGVWSNSLFAGSNSLYLGSPHSYSSDAFGFCASYYV